MLMKISICFNSAWVYTANLLSWFGRLSYVNSGLSRIGNRYMDSDKILREATYPVWNGMFIMRACTLLGDLEKYTLSKQEQTTVWQLYCVKVVIVVCQGFLLS